MNQRIARIANNVLQGQAIGREDAALLLNASGGAVHDLLYWANAIRRRFKGDSVSFCSILSARQGACSEDCKFCAQSARYRTDIPTHPLMSPDEIEAAAARCDPEHVASFGIVTSGASVDTEREWNGLVAAVRCVAGLTAVCASLGSLTKDQARQLRAAGLTRYNHNLETSRSYYPQVCTTHTYDERIATVRIARDAGLEVCCGGIFGMGESDADRIDLAFTLRDLDVDSVPLNFLHPIPGTPLQDAPALAPMKILQIIAAFRFVLPRKHIKVCGGRERNLRDVQSWMFYAGASGAILGDYLATRGRSARDDLQMVADLGLHPKAAPS